MMPRVGVGCFVGWLVVKLTKTVWLRDINDFNELRVCEDV